MSAEELRNLVSPKFTEQVLVDIVTKRTGLAEVKVEKIEIRAAPKKGDSYLSQICRFTIDATGKNAQGAEEAVSIPVFAKSLPSNLARRKTYRTTEFFENEIIFYNKVWPAFQQFQHSKKIKDQFDSIPLVFSAWTDGVHDYVAMLDVADQGYVSADRGSGLDYDHTVAILRLFAAFHGLSLAFKDQEPELFEAAATSLKETYFSERLRKWYSRFHEKVLQVVRDAVEKELPAEYLEKLNKLIGGDFYGELIRLCQVRGAFGAVIHGDVWVPNFLIRYDGGKPKTTMLIDFQLARYATLANDLTFFLLGCVDIEVLKQHWDGLIVEYHQALVDNLERFGSSRDLISLQALQAEIKANVTVGIGMSLEPLIMSQLDHCDVADLDTIQGDEAVPIEEVWLIKPFKEQEKRKRISDMIQFAVDRNFM